MAVNATIETVVVQFTAIAAIGIEITLSSVMGELSAIEADVATIMAKIGPVMAQIPAVIKTALGLGSNTEEQTGCKEYK
jgi:hypothetical protein